MSRTELKTKILKKFGKYSKFTRSAGLDRTAFQKDFLRDGASPSKEYLAQIASLIDRSKPLQEKPLLTKAQVIFLRKAINEYGGVTKLCNAGEGFSPDPIFKVLTAKHTTQTPTAKKLLEFFKYIKE